MEEIKSDVKQLLANQILIKEQVVKTNGRVSKLEDFRNVCKGVITVIVIFMLPIIFQISQQVVLHLFKNWNQ